MPEGVYMPDIITLVHEVDLEIDYLAEFRRTKKVPQNLFYTSEGAVSFYNYRAEDIEQIRWQDEFYFFQRQEFWSPASQIAFVSLGCGNAQAEEMFLHNAYEAGISIDYFGIDSSASMLNLAKENLVTESYACSYILADFTTPEFRNALSSFLEPYDVVIYAMIGGTFGNFDQAFIVQELHKIIPPGSYLYLDVVPQYDVSVENEKLRDRFSRLPWNLDAFFKQLLEKLCIPLESGELHSIEETEYDVGANRHTFFFKANEQITFPCFGENLTVYTGEDLELLSIRAYQVSKLQEYMRQHNFEVMDTYIPSVGELSHLWQRLLFRKVKGIKEPGA